MIALDDILHNICVSKWEKEKDREKHQSAHYVKQAST